MKIRINWRLCALQASLFAATQCVFSSTEAIRMAVYLHVIPDLLPLLTFSFATKFLHGMLLAGGAQWVMATPARVALRGALVVAVAAAVQGPLNEMALRVAARPFFGDSPLPVASGLFLLWSGALGGGLFFTYCLLLQRSRHRQRDLADAVYQCAELEIRVREAQASALERNIDPALLEQSLAALRRAYRRDRSAGESLLDALVECLRLAMPAIRDSGALPARQLADQAWGRLRGQLEDISAGTATAMPRSD